MMPLKSGPAATILQEYSEKTGCLGLVYLPNDTLTHAGLKLLKMAEKLRQELIDYDDDDDDELDSMDDSIPVTPPSSRFETPR
jgi:hypothetical protein